MIYNGKDLSSESWKTFIEKLNQASLTTSQNIARSQTTQDYTISLSPQRQVKEYDGQFGNSIVGVRSVTQLNEELVVCQVHIDVTEDIEHETGGRVSVMNIRYREHDSRTKTPRRYDKPFLIRFLPGGGSPEMLFFTPDGNPATMRYALENEIMTEFKGSVERVDARFPRDPVPFLDALGRVDRLDRIESVTARIVEHEGEPPREIRQPFLTDAGSLRDFKEWMNKQKRDFHEISLVKIICRVPLNDSEGSSFRLDIRPEDEKPLTVHVSMQSKSRGAAYTLISDILAEILDRN